MWVRDGYMHLSSRIIAINAFHGQKDFLLLLEDVGMEGGGGGDLSKRFSWQYG